MDALKELLKVVNELDDLKALQQQKEMLKKDLKHMEQEKETMEMTIDGYYDLIKELKQQKEILKQELDELRHAKEVASSKDKPEEEEPEEPTTEEPTTKEQQPEEKQNNLIKIDLNEKDFKFWFKSTFMNNYRMLKLKTFADYLKYKINFNGNLQELKQELLKHKCLHSDGHNHRLTDEEIINIYKRYFKMVDDYMEKDALASSEDYF